MPRIVGVDVPNNKPAWIALTYIHGIGRSSSKNILKQLEIDPKRKSGQLDDQDVARIREVIDNTYKVEGDLRRELSMNIKRLMDLGTYRGLRHRKSLPLPPMQGPEKDPGAEWWEEKARLLKTLMGD